MVAGPRNQQQARLQAGLVAGRGPGVASAPMKVMAATNGNAHNLKACEGPWRQRRRVSPSKVDVSDSERKLRRFKSCPRNQQQARLHVGLFAGSGSVFDPAPSRGSAPPHNVKAEGAQKALQWSAFSPKVEKRTASRVRRPRELCNRLLNGPSGL